MPSLILPTSSRPGTRPGEYRGRLVNVTVERDGDVIRYRPMPGLSAVCALPGQFRGALRVGDLLYVVAGTSALTVATDGTVTTLAGTVAGTGPVSLARNYRTSTDDDGQPYEDPDIVCVSSAAVYVLTASGVTAYPDPDLPRPSSVCQVSNYFVFPSADVPGQLYQSDVNTTAVDALDFATIADRIRRVVPVNGYLVIMGETELQVWQDAGNDEWAFSRVSVVPVGLRSPFAVAGHEAGWSGPLLFVSEDGQVHRLDSMSSTTPVSTPDVERAIARADRDDLIAHAYGLDGRTIWVLSSSDWTWAYDVALGSWTERRSEGSGRWRMSGSVMDGAGRWCGGDVLQNRLVSLDSDMRTEAGAAITSTIGAAPASDFPARIAVSALCIDVTLGHGDPAASARPQSNPRLRVRYSPDGGGRWSAPIEREIGPAGRYSGPVRVNRLGLTSHHGLIAEVSISDPVDWCLSGMWAEVEERKP